MTDITKEDLKAAFTEVSKKYADGVLGKSFTVTKMILKSAFDDGDIPSDPTRNLKKPKSRLPKKKKDDDLAAFSNEDLQVFFEKSIDYNFELYTIFTVLACTGMRPEELRALEWSSFDAEKKTIDVHQAVVNVFDKPQSFNKQPKCYEKVSTPKTEYGVRVLPLSNLAVQALLDWKKKLKADKNTSRAHSIYIFPNKNGDFKRRSGLESIVKRFRKKYHLENMKLHSYKFRHTMCTNLVLAGQPIPVIQRIMGDNTTDMILRVYAHVSNKNAIKAAAGFYADMNETNQLIASNCLPA